MTFVYNLNDHDGGRDMRNTGLLTLALLMSLTACGEKEIDACNSDRAKATLMSGTFLKMKNRAIEIWQKQLEQPFVQQALPYVCPAFSPPDTRYRSGDFNAPLGHGTEVISPTGQVKGRVVVPLSSQEYLDAHNKACAVQAARVQEQARRNEAQFNESHERIARNIALLNRLDVSISNIRQQKYDDANNVRYCAAEFEYQNLTTDLQYAIGNIFTLGDPSCRQLVTYKIEPLVDKPDSFYLTWQCH